MSYEEKESRGGRTSRREEGHRDGERREKSYSRDRRGGDSDEREGGRPRRSLSSKLASDGRDRRQARREFFTDRKSSEEGGRKRFSRSDRSDRFDRSDRSDEGYRRRDSAPYDDRNRRRRDDREERPYRRRFRDEEEKPRRYIADSPIVDEIVKKRKSEGRSSERKPKVLSLEWNEERGLIRLNKYIANAGVCSRREADKLIEAGAVTVNGVVVTELGTKVQPTDEVRYGDRVLQREKPVYILLNKPKDYITTTSDEYDRKNVMNLVFGACDQRVYPVGRLDRNTTGLLLITNDGELAKKLTHPRYGVKKIYHVELDRNLSGEDFSKIITGLELEDGFIAPDELAYVGESKREIGITLHSGKNRIVRRIFEHLGYDVIKLDRVYYAGLTKKDLPRGQWRFLRPEEVNILKMTL